MNLFSLFLYFYLTVLRNESGKTVGGLTEGLTSCSALHEEPEAAIRGLKLVAGLGYRRMIMETDS